tara:strand:- start:286 stop:822 length:537 start_codon:yes stop_codon:yes gene_type:complete
MKINVGTKNAAKLSAVNEALKDYDLFKGFEIEGLKVSSEVSDQPKSALEINEGAMNRARNAFQGCEYSFGIESGMEPDENVSSGYVNYCVCAVYDGENFYLGRSNAFVVPKNIVDLVIKKDYDIAEACQELGIGEKNLGSEEGLIGILTNGRVTRKEQTAQSIKMAMAELENSDLYPK